MLNRNGLFGKQEGRTGERIQRGIGPGGPGAYPAALPAAGQRALQPVDTSPIPDTEKTAEAATVTTVNPQGSKLIVGPNIKLKGVEITDCDTLVVEGHVEATMDSRSIQIAESGTFFGTVGIDIAEIRGTFSGELTARKRLVIHSTGKVSGKINYGKLVVEEGGELAGEVKTAAPLPQGKSGAHVAHHSAPVKPAVVESITDIHH